MQLQVGDVVTEAGPPPPSKQHGWQHCWVGTSQVFRALVREAGHVYTGKGWKDVGREGWEGGAGAPLREGVGCRWGGTRGGRRTESSRVMSWPPASGIPSLDVGTRLPDDPELDAKLTSASSDRGGKQMPGWNWMCFLFVWFFFLVFLPFLGLHPWHMEVPRLGV